MKRLKKNSRTEMVNRLGKVFGVVLIVCAAIARCGGAEISLEPMELLDLPLSKLSAVTAETSTTARKLNQQREAENQVTAKVCGEKKAETAAANQNRQIDVPVFIGFGSPRDYPFYPYPLFAADTPWLTPPTEEMHEDVPAEIVAEAASVEEEPETAPVENVTESAPLEDCCEPKIEELAWEGRIAAPKADSYQQMKLELQKLIYQVRAVELQARQAKIVSDAERRAMGTAEPNGLADANEVLVAEHKEVEQVRPPYIPVSDNTLKVLEDMAAKTGTEGAGLVNTLELAEILYRSRRLEQAAKVYRLAHEAAAADDNMAVEDKAWMLLQVGNCLRETDASAAAEAYKQIVTEYGNSMWKDMAKTQLELLNWYASDKPDELAAKNSEKSVGSQIKTEQQ